MVISLIEILSFYYEIEGSNYIEKDNTLYFVNDNKNYVFRRIEKDNIYIILESQNNSFFHKIIKNKYGNIYSQYSNNNYILLNIMFINNRIIDFNDIKILSNMKNIIYRNSINYSYLWEKKIDFLESLFIDNKDYLFEYFIGLGENAVNYCKSINYSNITIGYSYNRLKDNMNIFEFWDPTSINYGPIINNISEYIKKSIFNDMEDISLEDIFNIELTLDDYKLLIAKLLFPTYYFDLLKNKEEYDNRVEQIVFKIDKYLEKISSLIYEIKKRHIDIPLINWINHQPL